MTRRYSPAGAALASATLILSVGILLMPLSDAAAAHTDRTRMAAAETPPSPSSGAAAEPTSTGAAPASEEASGCYKARRKLWVDGQGWYVRRVTICP